MASVFVLLEAFNRKEAAALGFFPCATASYLAQTVGFEPRGIAAKFISSRSRYDRFDTSAYLIFIRTASHSVWKNARFRCKITMKSWVRDAR